MPERMPIGPSPAIYRQDQPKDVVMLAFARIAATVNAEHDPERTLGIICREARALFNVDSAGIWERDGDFLVARGSAGDYFPGRPGLRVPIDDPHGLAADCLRKGKPTLAKNVAAVDNWGDQHVRREPSAAVMSVPLIHRDAVLGVLGLRQVSDADHFTPFDVEVAKLFAEMAAVALVNARLQSELERRACEEASLSRLVRIVSSGRDLQETYRLFAHEISALVPCDNVTITTIEGTSSYRVLLAMGTGSDVFLPGSLIPLEGTALEWMARNGPRVLIGDLDEGSHFGADFAFIELGMRSSIRVPLFDRGDLIGLLNVASKKSNAYGRREVELLEQVGGQIAGVVGGFQMMEVQNQLLARLNALQKLTDAALSTLDLDSLLETLLDRCIEILGASGGVIMLSNQAGSELVVSGAAGSCATNPMQFRRRWGEGVVGKVAATGSARLVYETDDEPLEDVPLSIARGVHSILAVPLKIRGRVIGVVRVESQHSSRFRREHRQLMEVAAERMAMAIENARLLQEAQERASHEALIHRIASAIGSSLDLNQVISTAVVEMRMATEASRCLVALGEPEAISAEARWESLDWPFPSLQNRDIPWSDNPFVQATMRSREPVIVEDVDADSSLDRMRPLLRELDVRSMLSMVITQDGLPSGVIVLHQCGKPRQWTDWDVDLIKAMAAQLSVAVRNARLYGTTNKQLRARVRDLGSLLRLARAVGEELSLDLVMARAAEEAIFALDVDRCAMIDVDWETEIMTVRATYNRDRGAGLGAGRLLRLEEHPHYAEALRGKRPVRVSIEEIQRHTAQASILVSLGIVSCLLVPLMAGDRSIGLMFLGRRAGMPEFSDSDVSLAQAIASNVAVAVENALLFQQVRSQKAQTETLLTSMSEGVYATDLESRITAVNPWLENMVGLKAQEMLGRPCSEIFRHTDEAGVVQCDTNCPLRVALEEGKASDPRMIFVQTAWGERIPTVVSTAPLRDETGQLLGAVSVSRDVTREWQVDKLKSTIVSVVSHEFRTPLTSIVGFSDLLLTRSDLSEQERRTSLELILGEGLKLSALVSDFLDVSRLESGKVALNPEPIDVATTIEKGIDSVRRRAGGRVLRLDVEEALPEIEADPERLTQILENLLSNAIKYSKDDASIVVRARAGSLRNGDSIEFGEGGPDRWVVITVEDNGYGIPAEELSMLFQPFHRVPGELTRRIRGTGLGLSIVKSLVDLHGGRVWAESELGSGSRFHVALRAVSH